MTQTYPENGGAGNINEYLTGFLSSGMISISHTPDLISFEIAAVVNIFEI